MNMLKTLASTLLLFTLSACVTVRAPQPGPAWVALNETAHEGRISLTPLEVVENSRCPVDAECVWEGRFVLLTRLSADGRQAERGLTLGEPELFEGVEVTLVDFRPAPQTETSTEPADYRFLFSVEYR